SSWPATDDLASKTVDDVLYLHDGLACLPDSRSIAYAMAARKSELSILYFQNDSFTVTRRRDLLWRDMSLTAVGAPAPDFTLPDQAGGPVTLSRLWAAGPVILFFYPRDETAGCTAEACAFRDAYEQFVAAGAQVVGVSADSSAAHRRFADHHHLPY